VTADLPTVDDVGLAVAQPDVSANVAGTAAASAA